MGLMEAAAKKVRAGEPPQLKECVLRCTLCSNWRPGSTANLVFSHDRVIPVERRDTWHVVQPECCICKDAGKTSTLRLFRKDANGKEVPLTGIKYVISRTANRWTTKYEKMYESTK